MGGIHSIPRVSLPQNPIPILLQWRNPVTPKGKSQKSVAELEDEIEILKMQKKDLRQLVQERTYQLDQMKKLDAEHQSLRDRWKSNEEKAVNEVEVMESQTESLQKEIETL